MSGLSLLPLLTQIDTSTYSEVSCIQPDQLQSILRLQGNIRGFSSVPSFLVLTYLRQS